VGHHIYSLEVLQSITFPLDVLLSTHEDSNHRDFDSLSEVDFRIVDYGFNEATPVETKELVRDTLRRLYQPRNAAVELDAITALQVAIDR